MKDKKIKKRLQRISLIIAGLLLIGLIFSVAANCIWPFPEQKLNIYDPSPMVYDSKGREMLSLVSPQQQWCMPIDLENACSYLIDATIAVEDNRFYHHSGIDVYAVLRATGQNISQRRVVSGASTLTMQICRMMGNRHVL